MVTFLETLKVVVVMTMSVASSVANYHNECTKCILGAMSSCHRPITCAHARILESARANEMITCKGKYTEDF